MTSPIFSVVLPVVLAPAMYGALMFLPAAVFARLLARRRPTGTPVHPDNSVEPA